MIFWLLATAGNEGEDLATIEVEHIKLIPSISLKLEEDLEYLDLDDSME